MELDKIEDPLKLSGYLLTKGQLAVYEYLNQRFNNGEFMQIFSKYINSGNKIDMILDTVDNHLKMSNYDLSFEECISLLNIKVIDKFIEKLVKNNLDNIINYNFDFVNNSLVISLLRCYAILNNLLEEQNVENFVFDHYLTDDLLNDYLREINNYPLLTVEEEKILALKIEKGDLKAKERMICSNLRWVVKIAKRFQGRGLSLPDLIQEGNIGLMKAVDKFDVHKGFKFSTYSRHWILKSINDALVNTSKTINGSRRAEAILNKIDVIEKKTIINTGHKPTIGEVAEELNISISEVQKLYSLKGGVVSLNEMIGDGDVELGDFIEDDALDPSEQAIKVLLVKEVGDLLETVNLSDKEKEVLKYRYGLQSPNDEILTLEEIGHKYNVTRKRVSQIEVNALRKLRESKLIKEFADYMDNPDEALEKIDEYVSKYLKGEAVGRVERTKLIKKRN